MKNEIFLNPSQLKFQRSIRNYLVFKIFLLMKLPAAWIAGLNAEILETDKAIVSVKFKWINQNPFRSIYFAILSMAAEMSTGLLCMLYSQDENVKISMLVVGVNATFLRKAVGINRFICEEGEKVYHAVEEAKKTKEGVLIKLKSTGYSAKNEIIAVFEFEWSFKVK